MKVEMKVSRGKRRISGNGSISKKREGEQGVARQCMLNINYVEKERQNRTTEAQGNSISTHWKIGDPC